jgi:hypothetical protein
MLTLSATYAAAQGGPIMNLFGGSATIDSARSDQNRSAMLGMRPETVGAVAYFPLSLDAARSLRAANSTPRRLEITLPGGKSVTCTFSTETRPDGLMVLTGSTIGDAGGGRCDLVVDNGQVTGDIDIPSGRYRIVPLGSGTTHAVVEMRTEAFPNEEEPRRPS